MEKRFGDAYSYTKNPRAKIFQRDISHATETWKREVLVGSLMENERIGRCGNPESLMFFGDCLDCFQKT